MANMDSVPCHQFLDLSEAAEAALIAGARDTAPVRGFTHGYYKYPARFSPAFARAAIEAFTRPGDLCLDPHVGGGTTLVEALAIGRDAIGVDVSTLAEFVALAKCQIYSDREIRQLKQWIDRVPNEIDMSKRARELSLYRDLGYYRHLDHPDRWRLRKSIEQGLESACRLDTNKLQSFGRCVVLRSAQWALDGRRKQATVSDFRNYVKETALEMLDGARSLRDAVSQHCRRPQIRVLNRSSAGLENDKYIRRRQPKVHLVLTSPPYPGIHMLYHRWQVDGRKETPLPFMIANRLDGAGSAFYTMGDRKNPNLNSYFESIQASMTSVSNLADVNTVVVQMVAFSEPSWQLPRYLEAMRESGLREWFLPSLAADGDGRLWRSVPNRRWYSDQRGSTPGSQEVVLFHCKAEDTATVSITSPLHPSV